MYFVVPLTITKLTLSRYRQAFRETLLCRAVTRRNSRTCDFTIGREPTSQITAVFRHRESRKSSKNYNITDKIDFGNGRVDFVKDAEPTRVEHEDYELKTFSIA